MILKNIYWYFNQALPPRLCDDIVQFGLKQKKEMALTGNFGKGRDLKKNPLTPLELAEQKQRRNSSVSFITGHWLYKEIHPYIHTANKNAGWDFQWDFTEAFQFTHYTPGQYYGWHCDGFKGAYKEKKRFNYYAKIRKLSVVVSLSDGKDYKGGDLEFLSHNVKNKKVVCESMRNRGSLIVFPSFIWHRVQPVTDGERYSLVMWCLGKPFR